MRDSGKVYNHTPLGFQREGAKLLEDGPEMDTARRIITLRREGFSMNKIALIFNEEDVPSKLGGRWYASTVKRVLDRAEVYG